VARLGGLIAIGLAASGFASDLSAGSASVKIIGYVRPACAIEVHGATGQTIREGAYTFVVKDSSSRRYFRIRGPGLARQTSGPFVGTATWRVRLRAGEYRFQCAPKTRSMRGRFTVAS
jgi:hypothetical protein